MEIARKAAAWTLLIVASQTATAADQGFYFGLLGGRADYGFDSSPFGPAGPLIPPGGVTERLNPSIGDAAFVVAVYPSRLYAPTSGWQPGDDDESAMWGVVAGYRVMRYAALELNYLNLGTLKESETLLPFPGSPVGGTEQLNRKLETSGPSVSALGILPLLDQWNVYLRAGVLFADMESTLSLYGSSSSITFGSDSFLWGAGTQFDLGKHWSMRLDFQRFDSVGEINGSGRADIDLLSLGVLFRL